jgi:hypothetical protein
MLLPTQITLNWKPRFRSLRSIWVVILSKPTWLLGITIGGGAACWGDIGAAMLEGAQDTIAKFQEGEMRMLRLGGAVEIYLSSTEASVR